MVSSTLYTTLAARLVAPGGGGGTSTSAGPIDAVVVIVFELTTLREAPDDLDRLVGAFESTICETDEDDDDDMEDLGVDPTSTRRHLCGRRR